MLKIFQRVLPSIYMFIWKPQIFLPKFFFDLLPFFKFRHDTSIRFPPLTLCVCTLFPLLSLFNHFR